jgi:hypothetical protein
LEQNKRFYSLFYFVTKKQERFQQMSINKNPKQSVFAVIQNIEFQTKASLENHIREMIANAEKGWGLFLESKQEEFMKELIETRYDKYDEKIGERGLAGIFVDRNQDYPNTFCFYIVRKDGTCSDISWKACLTARRPHDQVRRAFRTAIVSQILDFKNEIFGQGKPVYCHYTNELLTSDNCHIDHVAPKTFEYLLKNFLDLKQLKEENIELTGSVDLSSVRKIANPTLKAEWEKYHKDNAELRALSKLGNTSHAKKEANTYGVMNAKSRF